MAGVPRNRWTRTARGGSKKNGHQNGDTLLSANIYIYIYIYVVVFLNFLVGILQCSESPFTVLRKPFFFWMVVSVFLVFSAGKFGEDYLVDKFS